MNAYQTMTERRKTLYAMIFVFGVCIILALIAEGAVRLRALLKYGYVWGVESTFDYDSDLDLRLLKPGTEFGPIRVNSLGFRGPEIDGTKSDQHVRIAFLGGSTTYCAEVSSNETTWPHFVWQYISEAAAGAKVDYINGGVPGYGIDSSLKNLQYRVAELNPDVIVIYHATNDLSANSFAAARRQGLVEQRPGKQKFWLSNYSLLIHLVEMNLRIMRSQENSGTASGVLEIDSAQLAAPFREDLEKLVVASKQHAQLVALVTFSTQMRKEQTDDQKAAASVSSLYYMPYMSPDSLIEAFALYNRIIRDVAKEHGVLLIDAEFAVPGDTIHFNDSVHLKDAGSRAMAARVARDLLQSHHFLRLIGAASVSEN